MPFNVKMGELGDNQEIIKNGAERYSLVLQNTPEELNNLNEFCEEEDVVLFSPGTDEIQEYSSLNLNEPLSNENESDALVRDNDASIENGNGLQLCKTEDDNHNTCRQCRAEAEAANDKSPDSSPLQNNSWSSGDELRSKRISTSSLSSQALLTGPQNPMEEKKKKKVGHYLLENTIGQGSYATVHVATHLLTRQKVAVKVVTKKTLVQNETSRHHFRREALLLPRLSHPNIIKLYEAMETPNSYYLVFELVVGGHLLTLVSQKGNLTEEESRVFMKQIVSAVDHLHQSDIVHRDIRLENILVDENSNIKLVDFGFSTVCHMNELTTQCGCPVYAAPEVFAGRKYGRPVDIWSLGICFYGMLLGRLPFLPVSNSLSQLFSIILRGCLIPNHLTQSCQNLLSRMLDNQEGRRITIDEIPLHHWMTFPDGQPIRRYPALPKRLHASNVKQHVVKYMCSTFRFNETDIMNSVTDRRLTSSAATYHILREKMKAGKERGWQTPTTYKALNKSRVSHQDTNTSATAVTALPAVTPSGVISVKTLSTQKKSASNKSERPGPSRSKSSIRKGERPDTPNAYKSYILVLKQSRLNGAEPAMSKESTANEMYFDLLQRSPPYFTVDSANSASLFPSIMKADSTPVKHLMRIDTNNHADLGVTGTSPLIHDRVSSMDYNNNNNNNNNNHGSVMSSATNSRASASLRPSTVKMPPPAPPNSSLDIAYADIRPKSRSRSRSRSPGIQPYEQNLSPQSSTSITHKTIQLTKTPPKKSTGSSLPSLSSLRESLAVDMWNRSRLNIRIRPKPTVSLLRSKKSELTSTEIRVQGKSQQLIHDKDSNKAFDGYITWGHGEDARRNSKNEGVDGMELQQNNVSNFLDSLSSSNREGFDEMGDQDTETTVENGIQRSITLASIPTQEKSKQTKAIPGAMVRIVHMHSAKRSESPHLLRNEMESRLSQSLERDDFMTPVTRVTITTIQKDS